MLADGTWKVRRVGGDQTVQVVEREGSYFFAKREGAEEGPGARLDRVYEMSITTPLPEGYPAPTPPGAIELKRYPSVRRAEFSAPMRLNADLGMNGGFFPLFRHIQRRNIAMTSPVEMDYGGVRSSRAAATGNGAATAPAGAGGAAREGAGAAGAPAQAPAETTAEWTMSFLYRTADLGPTGVDETNKSVKIVDTEPVVVLAVGMRGAYSLSRVKRAVEDLDLWLAEHPEWEPVGDVRAMYYNGPEQSNRNKWGEAQVRVRPASAAGAGASGASGGSNGGGVAAPAAPAKVETK